MRFDLYYRIFHPRFYKRYRADGFTAYIDTRSGLKYLYRPDCGIVTPRMFREPLNKSHMLSKALSPGIF